MYYHTKDISRVLFSDLKGCIEWWLSFLPAIDLHTFYLHTSVPGKILQFRQCLFWIGCNRHRWKCIYSEIPELFEINSPEFCPEELKWCFSIRTEPPAVFLRHSGRIDFVASAQSDRPGQKQPGYSARKLCRQTKQRILYQSGYRSGNGRQCHNGTL